METSEQKATVTLLNQSAGDTRSGPDVQTPQGWQPSPPVVTHPHAVKDEPPTAHSPARSRQRVILQDEAIKAAELGLFSRSSVSHPSHQTRQTNQRRSQQLLKFVGLIYAANLLLMGAFGVWFYNVLTRQLDERLADSGRPPSAPQIAAVPPPLSPSVSPAEMQKLASTFKAQLSDLQAQLQASQKRLANTEQQNEQQAAHLKSLAETTTLAPSPQSAPALLTADTLATDAALPPSQTELILLKERNRLTSYADEAIATGAREPYDRLWAALDDPRLSNLIHAARTEILRVQNYYLSGSRIEHYDIPVGDYFPDSASLRDSQLADDKLIDLMGNSKHPWQVRLKAANLLGLRRSTSVGTALVQAIKEDKNLDVVKEATFSFEQMTGYRAKLFDPASLETWWKQYNTSALPVEKITRKPSKETNAVEEVKNKNAQP